MIYLKKILFLVLYLMFLLPFIQDNTNLFKIKSLKGYYIEKKKPVFFKRTWLNGKFQENMDDYYRNSFGLRSLFVRINNQIDYNLFNKSLAANVIIGQDKILFQDFYISSLWGEDFVGESVICQKVSKLAEIQQKLKERGQYFIFLIAPGKATIYEDKLPKKFFDKPKSITNYDVCIREMKKQKINLIDIRSYFMQIKNKSPYPLFPRCGTHWSGYGLTIVADTLFKYMENISGIDLVDFNSEKGEITSINMRFTDNDIGEAMNLLWSIPNYPMYYPNIIFKNDSTKVKPSLLGIGDSFGQSFYGFYPYFDNLFDKQTQYWSYFKGIAWPEELQRKSIQVDDIDISSELSKYDFIVIVSTEQNLVNLGFGFIEKVYPMFYTN